MYIILPIIIIMFLLSVIYVKLDKGGQTYEEIKAQNGDTSIIEKQMKNYSYAAIVLILILCAFTVIYIFPMT